MTATTATEPITSPQGTSAPPDIPEVSEEQANADLLNAAAAAAATDTADSNKGD